MRGGSVVVHQIVVLRVLGSNLASTQPAADSYPKVGCHLTVGSRVRREKGIEINIAFTRNKGLVSLVSLRSETEIFSCETKWI
jgi:hypothetical protein